ncbi:MAG: hypothetical protein EBV77_09655, partial [Gemmatimonadaceae bacterium]|nr:hypothetical protein [Gemmatimonadaceae bacterium]
MSLVPCRAPSHPLVALTATASEVRARSILPRPSVSSRSSFLSCPMRHARRQSLLLSATVSLVLAMPVTATAQRNAPVFIDELTWTEIRDRMQAGTRSVIIGTAGQEQKGPHMVDGEHKWVLTHTTERIARTLGDALVAPILTYVPEGSWDAPLRGHMAKPGSITLPEDRFVELLVHAARSLKNGGFTQIIYIGDSGGNQ